ncbi:MAG: formylglycine-generating enzyme family protein [Byssovorax sp.]
MSQQARKNSGEEPASITLQAGNQGIELLLIPAGSFLMGSQPTEPGHRDAESPVRRIKISKPFYIGRHEITQGQYKAVIGINPSRFIGDDLAVDQITHADANEFCRKLSALVGRKVTLPTEAQWECACRAGTTTRFYTGNMETDLDRAAWSRRNSDESVHPVGTKEPNAFGLFDMLGNVWEHCLDVLPDYATISDVDPVGTTDDEKGSMRGGGWMNDAEYCRAACGLRTSDMFGGAGIRIVINPE